MALLRCAMVVCLLAMPLRADDFRRSDCNGDGAINIADAITILGYLFPAAGVTADPQCEDACDVNDDGDIDLADAVFHLSLLKPPAGVFQFPPAPYPDCGPDGTPTDSLDCLTYTACP